jgi:MFS family permease
LNTAPQMRGRVMALWSVAFMGSTPIGGPLIGFITAAAGARVGLGVGALSCFGAALLGLVFIHHLRTARESQAVTTGTGPADLSPQEAVAEGPDGSLEAAVREPRP